MATAIHLALVLGSLLASAQGSDERKEPLHGNNTSAMPTVQKMGRQMASAAEIEISNGSNVSDREFAMGGTFRIDRFSCDFCMAVVKGLNEAVSHGQLEGRQLQSSEYHKIVKSTCDNIALHLPPTTCKDSGVLCRAFVYERIPEDALHEAFQNNGELSQQVCFGLNHTRPYCKLVRTNRSERSPDRQQAKESPSPKASVNSRFLAKLETASAGVISRRVFLV